MVSFNGWHSLKTDDIKKYLSVINRKHKFFTRSEAEDNPSWQQIIPYLIFENSGKYFVMQRRTDHTDLRLANKFSIGIGGHINKSDIGSKSIMDWADREFKEEVDYSGKYKSEFLGLINDDSNDVGLVHIGLVIKISGDLENITVRDEHKLGRLSPLSRLGGYF